MSLYLVSASGKKQLFSSVEFTDRFSQFIGLMFRAKCVWPLLFKCSGRIAIHSLFCPSFEAVFLDKQRRVVKILQVTPGQRGIAANAFYLLELPPGTVARFKIKKGDELTWTEN